MLGPIRAENSWRLLGTNGSISVTLTAKTAQIHCDATALALFRRREVEQKVDSEGAGSRWRQKKD